MNPEIRGQLETALRNASVWLEERDMRRQQLFADLDRAVTEHRTGKVRRLVLRVEATASEGRTEAEDLMVARATDYVASPDFATHQRIERGLWPQVACLRRHLSRLPQGPQRALRQSRRLPPVTR
ncbi:hypothetical protein JCM4814A_80940 [Streptomyces phaeofaciens JCM 4814]|uniref:Uncharacterized protein n=1 Tax=Streptomyces phaeofaciens TaxID=68254 RepID=A0A918HQA2_9ACTN|nr:hypothetical protein GCM10010226_86560 [Streptomyces phaeofaciens]